MCACVDPIGPMGPMRPMDPMGPNVPDESDGTHGLGWPAGSVGSNDPNGSDRSKDPDGSPMHPSGAIAAGRPPRAAGCSCCLRLKLLGLLNRRRAPGVQKVWLLVGD